MVRMRGWWWWWWWWGVAFANARQERGVWAKKSKLSCHGSILGAPYKTAKGDRAEGWCGGVYEAAAGVGLCTRETQGREGVLGQNPKLSCCGSI
jgi:hypothetical protein